MGLADTFTQIVDSLPEDWTDLELDMRIAGSRGRQIGDHFDRGGAALFIDKSQLQAYLDMAELVVRETRSGRVEVTQMWGRPQSAREEFRRLRAQ